jgi:hypothetical protein
LPIAAARDPRCYQARIRICRHQVHPRVPGNPHKSQAQGHRCDRCLIRSLHSAWCSGCETAQSSGAEAAQIVVLGAPRFDPDADPISLRTGRVCLSRWRCEWRDWRAADKGVAGRLKFEFAKRSQIVSLMASTVSLFHPSNPEIRLASEIAYQPSMKARFSFWQNETKFFFLNNDAGEGWVSRHATSVLG